MAHHTKHTFNDMLRHTYVISSIKSSSWILSESFFDVSVFSRPSFAAISLSVSSSLSLMTSVFTSWKFGGGTSHPSSLSSWSSCVWSWWKRDAGFILTNITHACGKHWNPPAMCYNVTQHATSTVMRWLTTGIRSEKCVVRRFHRRVNIVECTYTNLDGIAYYTPILLLSGYKPVQHVTVLNTVGNCNTMVL